MPDEQEDWTALARHARDCLTDVRDLLEVERKILGFYVPHFFPTGPIPDEQWSRIENQWHTERLQLGDRKQTIVDRVKKIQPRLMAAAEHPAVRPLPIGDFRRYIDALNPHAPPHPEVIERAVDFLTSLALRLDHLANGALRATSIEAGGEAPQPSGGAKPETATPREVFDGSPDGIAENPAPTASTYQITNDYEESIADALLNSQSPLTAERLYDAMHGKSPASVSHHKGKLSEMRRRGILDNKSPGYVLTPGFRTYWTKVRTKVRTDKA